MDELTSPSPPTASSRRPATPWWLGPQMRDFLQTTLRALRLLVILTMLCGVIFPLLLFGIGQAVFPIQANGSLFRNSQGQLIGSSLIGSSLIGQQFINPAYFHGRPSATQPGGNIVGKEVRFGLAIVALVLAGRIALQPIRQPTHGTLPTDTLLFGGIIIGTALLVVALTYLPALALGPIVEHLQLFGH